MQKDRSVTRITLEIMTEICGMLMDISTMTGQIYKEHKNDCREIIVQLGDEEEFKELCEQVGEKRAREIHTEFTL